MYIIEIKDWQPSIWSVPNSTKYVGEISGEMKLFDNCNLAKLWYTYYEVSKVVDDLMVEYHNMDNSNILIIHASELISECVANPPSFRRGVDVKDYELYYS